MKKWICLGSALALITAAWGVLPVWAADGPAGTSARVEGQAVLEGALAANAPIVSGTESPTTNPRPTWTWYSGGNGGVGWYRYGFSEGSWLAANAATQFTVAADVYDPLTDGPHTLYVQESDAAENWSSSGSYTVVVDLNPPTATLSSDSGAQVRQDSIQVDITLSEPSRGLTAAALQLVNASVQEFVYANSMYTFTLKPAAEGDFSASIPEGRFQDVVGHYNTASNTLSRRYDITAPAAPVITTDGGFGAGQDFPTIADVVRLDGTAAADVAVILVNGAETGVTFTPGSGIWRYEGALGIGVNAFEVIAGDLAGNHSAAVGIRVTRLGFQDAYVSPTGDDASLVGSVEAPWRTIGHAMDTVRSYGGGGSVTIHLAPGTYGERVVMEPLTALVGDPAAQRSEVRISPVKAQLLDTIDSAYALSAAQDTRLENLSLELPVDAPQGSEVLRIQHVKCLVTNIGVNGSDVSGCVGISILGADSSATVVSKSLVERVDFGLRAVETNANITQNEFRDIRFDAVFVRGPASKDVGTSSTPMLGDVSQAGSTGANQFSNVSGFFVRNMNSETMLAQMNYWGLETEAEIAAKMNGPVTFVPFITGGTGAASVVCTVKDAATNFPVQNASVAADGGTPVTANVSGAYMLSGLVAGSHTLDVTAPGYITATRSVDLAAGAVTAVTVLLNMPPGHTLTYTAGENGYISGALRQTVSDGGDGTAVTAVPDGGYHFVQWSDGVLTAARTDTNVSADISVTAAFAINVYTLTYTADQNGSISGTPVQTVNYGANGAAVSAVAKDGCHFVQWSDGLLTATRTDTNVKANISVTAMFAVNMYTLTYTAGANGTLVGESPQTVIHGGTGTAVMAVAATNYHFAQWSDGVLTASRTDANVTGNISVTAMFAFDAYTVTVQSSTGGTVALSPSQPAEGYLSGTGVTVTATANPGYAFLHWTGDLSGAANPASLVMNGPKTVGAVFDLASSEGENSTFESIIRSLISGFALADKDHNGGLSWAEASAYAPALTQEEFNSMDTDGSGELTLAELNQALNQFGCSGCSCGKSNLSLDGLKGRMADLFLMGLALTSLLAVRGRKP